MKFTNIGKYIKKNQLRWLLFLLVPMVIGLIIHFVIPLLFVLNANPRVQLAYNNKKIQVEQNSIRSLSLLNSELIRLRLQVYENVRNVITKIFGQSNPYQKIDENNISLNNANFYANNYQTSNLTANKSMWYAQGVSEVSQLNFVQQQLFSEYLAVQPYILSLFLNLDQSQQILVGLSFTANYLGSSIYFQYPSQFVQEFSSLTTSSLDLYYNESINNYFLSNGNFQYSMFTEYNPVTNESYLVSCNVILVDDGLSGVSCFYLNLSLISLQLTESLGIPNVSYSQTSYYLLTPIYPSYEQIQTKPYSPRIVLNFTDKNIKNISIPVDSYYTLPSSISQNLYYPLLNSQNYKIFISEETPTLIHFQVPIQIYDYTQSSNIIMYLLVQYNFQKAIFNSQEKYNRILQSLAIPSSIIIVVSIIASLIVIKCLLNCMDEELFKINQKCQYIIHGDLDVYIPEYKQTLELQEVYKQVKTLNLLNKFSTPQYFIGDDASKVVKFHKVNQLFKQLSYPTDTALQNIGQCYFNIGQYQRGIQYLNQSYEMLVKQIQQNFGYTLDQIFQIKKSKNQKLSKQYKKLQLKLTGRLWKLIHCIFRYLMPIPSKFEEKQKNSQVQEQSQKLKKKTKKKMKYQKLFQKALQVFRKAAYPNFINTEGLGTFLLEAQFELSKKNYKNTSNCLRRFQRMMNQYENQYQKFQQSVKNESNIKKLSLLRHNLSQNSRTNPLISWSYFYYIVAKVQMTMPQNQRKYSTIVQNLAKSLSLDVFMCDIMCLAHSQILQLFDIFKLEKKMLHSLTYFKQLFPLYSLSQKRQKEFNSNLFKPVGSVDQGIQKQIFFLFDCSNKWITEVQGFRKWQKQTREISAKIFNLLKQKDRISISKANSNIYLETCCNLIYKNHNQVLLKKQLTNAVKLKFMSGKCLILKALQICVNRIKTLNQEKYFIIFLKQGKDKKPNLASNNSLKQSSPLILKNYRKNTEILQTLHKISFQSNQQQQLDNFIQEEVEQNNQIFVQYYKSIKQEILKILLDKEVKNLKLILVCENAQSFRNKFNLQQINAKVDEYCFEHNYTCNNLLFVVDPSLKEDLQRIFGSKQQIKSARNNVNAL